MSPRREGGELAEFLLRICHELRTPVRAVRSYAELLQREPGLPGSSEREQALGFVAEGASRLDLLVNSLAAYSIALQITPASFQSVQLDAMLRAVLARLSGPLRSLDAQVTARDLPQVHGHPDRLMEVLEILLRNALVHCGETKPVIQVAAAEQDEWWRVSVRDNGRGIDAAYLESIFRPFERLHPRRGTGPGLGLTIARTIVERHGGRLWAESPTGGTAFLFTLPR
jgi:signal transduction histidine kinase